MVEGVSRAIVCNGRGYGVQCTPENDIFSQRCSIASPRRCPCTCTPDCNHPMKRLLGLTLALSATVSLAAYTRSAPPPGCAPGNAGLKLPEGFCATLFADSLFSPRHMVVAPNGDVIVAIRESRRDSVRVPGGVVVLHDADGDGRADRRNKFGDFSSSE